MNLVNGMFYIDNAVDTFYLRESDVWLKKGKLVRANITGLHTEERFPYTATQVFELAPSDTAQTFHQDFSAARSAVRCAILPQAALDVILTDNLAGWLGKAINVVCRASFTPASQQATLSFNNVYVPAFAPLWAVCPATPDATFAGLSALWAGEPA